MCVCVCVCVCVWMDVSMHVDKCACVYYVCIHDHVQYVHDHVQYVHVYKH